VFTVGMSVFYARYFKKKMDEEQSQGK
jgi:hypothetical protein